MEINPDGFIRTLAEMRDQVGAHRILFGSDYAAGPARSGDKSTWGRWVDFIKNLPERASDVGMTFTKEEVSLMLGENAGRILSLKT